MLKKDEEVIRKGFREQFKKEFELIGRNRRVVFKLTKSIYNKETGKIPRSYSFPTDVTVFEKDGDSSEYVYYKTKRDKLEGGVMQRIYSPSIIIFSSRGDLTVDIDREPDLFIFLMKHSRRALSATGSGKQKPWFHLEDKTAEAREKVAKNAARVSMQKYLYDTEHRLSNEKLITIAQALRVPHIDSETDIAEVQTGIERMVSKNPQMFLEMTEVGDSVKMRSNIQLAAEKGFLSYDQKRKIWSIIDKDGGMSGDLCNVRQNEDPMARLVFWLQNIDERDHYGKITELLTGKPSKRKPQPSQSGESDLDKQLKLQEMKNRELELKAELARAENGNSDIPKSEGAEPEFKHPFLEDLDLDELKELGKPFNFNYSHLTTPESLIKKLKKLPKDKWVWQVKELVV